ncbi:MAG: alpha/beta fold hydrolase [Labilithrix sp.]|nr:alpha/beta fold hydrolase [Labilithrix sp.]MCW5814990.1 alpha/beta fold hydrolase [Labilithrix sp.]
MTPSTAGDIPLLTWAPEPGGEGRGAVLLFHGLRMGADSLAREAGWLVARGFTVLGVDAPHHGRRSSEVVETMPDALTLEGHYVLLRLLREARAEIPALVDHARALGHERVAIAGVSFGAFIALAAAAVEPRLDAFVSILGTPDWTPRDGAVPDDLREAVAESPHHRPEAFAPRPLLLLNGGADDNVRPGPARDLAARLRPLYEAAGAGASLVHHEYPNTPHFVEEPEWADMWQRTGDFLIQAFASKR